MTTTLQKVLAGVVGFGALLGLLAFLGVHLGGGMNFGSINNGASVINYPQWFTNGTGGTSAVVYAGNTQQWSITDGGLMKDTGTFQLGTSGTAQANQVITTCSLKADNSISATSTGYAYCTGATGVTSSDNLLALFATSTLGFSLTTDNWQIISAKASTTAGSIDFELYNGTGKTQVPSAAGRMGSTTVIFAIH